MATATADEHGFPAKALSRSEPGDDATSIGLALLQGRRSIKPPVRFTEEDSPPSSPKLKKKRSATSSAGVDSAVSTGAKKRTRCGVCAGCRTESCGVCRFCLDMPKFGGSGTLRQPCAQRACEKLLRERQEAQREATIARQAQREAERASSASQSKVLRHDTAIHGKRRPSVESEALVGGWGLHMLKVGSAVEVSLKEEGLFGSLYSGVVLSRGTGQRRKPSEPVEVLVQFDELLESEDTDDKLKEWYEPTDVRWKPPPPPPGFHRLLQKGDLAELYHEDGWWEVQVEEVMGAGTGQTASPGLRKSPRNGDDGAAQRFRVSSLMYAVSHVVCAGKLRPLWKWDSKIEVWRYELHAGHGFGDATTGERLFKFAYNVCRSHNDVDSKGGLLAPLAVGEMS